MFSLRRYSMPSLVSTLGSAVLLLAAAPAFSQQFPPPQPKGVPARSAPTDYPAHVLVDGVTYGAAVVPSEELKHIFAFDISRSYVVLEVAVYPGTGSAVKLDPEGFVVKLPRIGDVAHSADSVTVASVIQQKNLPKPASNTGPVVASTEVGYESGRDPYTGQRVHGTYTDTQVAIAPGRDPGPPRYPSPGGYPQDRQLLESQLWDKSLPALQAQHPTAGYLYFPASLLKKNAGGVYQLQYLGPQNQDPSQPSPVAKTIDLPVPVKNR